MARWQSGHAAACKAAYAGSIPTLASIAQSFEARHWRAFFVPAAPHAYLCRSPLAGDAPAAPERSIPREQVPYRAPAPMLRCAGFPAHDPPAHEARPDGETGRRKGLKIPQPRGYAGSIPAPGTIQTKGQPRGWPLSIGGGGGSRTRVRRRLTPGTTCLAHRWVSPLRQHDVRSASKGQPA